MLFVLGIIILLISFFVALASMIREKRRISDEQRILEAKPETEVHEPQLLHSAQAELNPAPDASHLDVLKTRIDELQKREEEQAINSGANDDIDKIDAEKQNVSSTLHVIEPNKGDDQDEGLRDLFGPGDRFPTSGTISMQDLVREKDQSKVDRDLEEKAA